MTQAKTIGIALGAGFASALLFAASAKGGPFALVIACLTPLPIMLAALGFAQSTGLIAAGLAVVLVCGLHGALSGGFFGALIAFPAWWLAYLTLLARPKPQNDPATPPALAWYPVGHVVAWAAFVAAAVFLAVGAATIHHFGSYERALTTLAEQTRAALVAADAQHAFADQAGMVVRLLPPLFAGLAFLALTFNLWLAARVVQGSGLLVRPWPPLPETLRLPRAAAIVLVLAGLATFVGGVVGMAAGIVFAPLGLAFVMQGLGAAHALTRGLAARRLILFAIYLVTLSLAPSTLALLVLGVVDCLLPLRRLRTGPQPLPTKPGDRPWK